jgi:hypothetical protein
MPYTYRKQGSKYCVYKKDGGDKVGCTAGNKTALKRYLTALHMHESLTELRASGVRKITSEDLRAWFGKGGKGGVGGGGWDRYNSSGDRIGKCGDAKEGDAYAACLSKEKARKLGKAGRAAFVKRKRAAQSKGGDTKKGGERSKGQKPIKVRTGASESIEERLNLFLEKNIPTDAGKWSYYKGQAKKKFDVYPSAYANAWAANMYKKAGGGWRKEK